MWDYLYKTFTIKLDSGDEDSGDEALKNARKGKGKLTDSNISSKAIDKGKSPEVVTSKTGSPEASASGDKLTFTRQEYLDLIVNAS
jgi:hypothetical protein